MRLLIVDDYKMDRDLMAAPFQSEHDVKFAKNLDEATRIIEKWWPDVVLLDAIFPRTSTSAPAFSAEAFLEVLELNHVLPLPRVVLVSGQNAAAEKFDDVRQWLLFGRIADVVPKSTADLGVEFFKAVIQLRVELALERERWQAVRRRAESAFEWFAELGIVTRSPVMMELKNALIAAARSSSPVLLAGPPGTGKELFARAIHKLRGADRPFREQNCGAISVALFEAEMFGSEKHGDSTVFTGNEGLFRSVKNGVLHLNEIHNTELSHQAKLLEVLDTGEFRPLGATKPEKFVGKIVVATNVDLYAKVAEGKFRGDLLDRIDVFSIRIPTLSERFDDVPLLIDYFLQQFVDRARAEGNPCAGAQFDADCMSLLSQYRWPGNVRELRNVIERALFVAWQEQPDPLLPVQIRRELVLRVAPRIAPAPVAVVEPQPAAQPSEQCASSDPEQLAGIIQGLLDERGRERMRLMVCALGKRAKQDPEIVHVLRGLLYILHEPDHRANVQDLCRVTQLKAWDSGKKILLALGGKAPGAPEYAGFVELPSAGARQEAVLLPGLLSPAPDVAGPGAHATAP